MRAFLGERNLGELADNLDGLPGTMWQKRPNRALFHLIADEGTLSMTPHVPGCSLVLESPAMLNGDITGRVVQEDVFSGEDISVQAWLADCVQHSSCCKTVSGMQSLDPHNAPLPRRCIDVGTKDDEHIHLEETSQKHGAYVTLSHRWNDETDRFKTTCQNYNRRLLGHFKNLPRVFREAIQVTWQLGLRYLWIDSICIIQDGENDWSMEAGQMATYYQHALVNLTATMEERLLPHSALFKRQLVQLPYRDRNGLPKGHFYVTPFKRIEQHYEDVQEQGQLLGRGWVYQEWLLCRRTLCFTPACVIFSCQSTSPFNLLFEGPGLETSSYHNTGEKEGIPNLVARQHQHEFAQKKLTPQLWYEVVETYSALRLTYPAKDRLLALDGIAREFEKALSANATTVVPNIRHTSSGDIVSPAAGYTIGLLPQDLHDGLLWEQVEANATSRLEDYSTWSWASVPGAVVWNLSSLRTPMCSIRDPIRMADQPYIATLRVSGRMQTVFTRRYFEPAEIKVLFEKDYRPRAKEKLYQSIWPTSESSVLCEWGSFEHPDFGVPESRDTAGASEREVYALHISTQRGIWGGWHLGYWLPWHHVYFILFLRLINGNRYERIGMGVLLGREVEANFQSAEEQHVQLV